MLKILAAATSVVIALVAAASVVAAPSRSHVQNIHITIMRGDYLSTGGNYALAPGVPVRVTVTNFTREFHTFTVPGLGVSQLVGPANGPDPSTTTFTFTAHTWGALPWHCLICPSGMHGRQHQMSGVLYIIVNPSAVT